MFSSLGSALDSISKGKMYLISENGTDGSFVYHHLMHNTLKQDSMVCFVGSLQTFQHHCSIQSKHGLNLSEKQQFIYIDAVKMYTENDTSSVDLKGLLQMIQFELKQHEGKRILLVIEELSVFVSLGAQIRDIVTFVTYCKGLMRPKADSLNSMVVLLHVDQSDEDSVHLCNYLTDLCEVLIEVNSLSSGHYAHVDGEISMTNFEDFECKSDFRMHFKLDERNLRLFAPGTSPTVL